MLLDVRDDGGVRSRQLEAASTTDREERGGPGIRQAERRDTRAEHSSRATEKMQHIVYLRARAALFERDTTAVAVAQSAGGTHKFANWTYMSFKPWPR